LQARFPCEEVVCISELLLDGLSDSFSKVCRDMGGIDSNGSAVTLKIGDPLDFVLREVLRNNSCFISGL
jgi:hypothetical protein